MSERLSKRPVTKKSSRLADVGLFYAALIWGSTFFIVKGVLDDIDPVVMVGYRFLIAGGLLAVFLWRTGRSFTQGIGRAAFLSVILYSLYVSQTVGLRYTTASNSGFITGLFVFFTPALLRILFHSRPTLMEWVASFISLGGLWVLTGGLHDINIGDLLTLIAALTYALHVLYSDKYMKAGVDPYTISCQQFLLVGLMSVVTGWIFNLPFAAHSTSAWLVVVFLALFPTLSAFVIQMLAQRITSPIRVTLIFALEPVFAAIFAWTLGGETPVAHRAAGGLLIAAALALSGLPTPSFLKPARR